MSARWMRRPPRSADLVAAASAAVVAGGFVGAVVYYLTRTLLAREPLAAPTADEGKAGRLPPDPER